MKKSTLSFIVFAVMVLPSCAPYIESSQKMEQRADITALPNNFSLLNLGQIISHGSVDIFDPWLTTLALPRDTIQEKTDNLLTFPEHPYMLIRDSSVVVYSVGNENSAPDSDNFFKMMDNLSSDINKPIPEIEVAPL